MTPGRAPLAASVVAVAIVLVVSLGPFGSWPVYAWAAGFVVLSGWWWLPALVRKSSMSALLALGTVAIAGGSILAGGPGAVAGLVTILALAPSGLSVGTALYQRPQACLWAAGAIGAVQWPLILLQITNPASILDRVAADTSGLTGSQIQSVAHGLRPVGTFVSPGLLAVSLLAGMALAARARAATPAAWLPVILAAGHAGALLATGSRAAILAAVVGSVVVLRATRVAIAMAVVGLIVVLAGPAASSRVGIETRLEILRQAWHTMADHRVFGVGWGQTPEHVSTVADGRIYHLHLLPVHMLFEFRHSRVDRDNAWVHLVVRRKPPYPPSTFSPPAARRRRHP